MVLDFLVIDHITDEQPTFAVKVPHTIPANVPLADPEYYKPGKIDVLLGADVFMKVLRSHQIAGSPTFQETAFGFIVAGSCDVENTSSSAVSVITTCTCLLSDDEPLRSQLENFYKAEAVQMPEPSMSAEEIKCEEHFVLNTKRDTQGRFEVRLPTQDNLQLLGESRGMAMRRFFCTERRLQRDERLATHYRDFMRKYEQLGHMRELPPSYKSPMPEVYLSHHPVIKASTTTPVRVVFDASARTSTGLSLNSVLLVGPRIQDDIFDILLRYRQHNVILRADIEKMYRQIRVHDQDQSMQRILYRESPQEPIKTYLLETVTYGTACAPFLAVRCLKQLAQEERHRFPLAASTVDRDFYVDDVLIGAPDINTAQELQRQLHDMLQCGGFTLKKWASNSADALQHVPVEDQESGTSLAMGSDDTITTLGMNYSPSADEFRYSATEFHTTSVCRRSMLSDTARMYDPLGLLAPLTVKAKILIQSLWALKVDWDTELNSEIQDSWQQYQTDVSIVVSQLSVPRHITCFTSVDEAEIFGFCAASEKAYAACVYIRTRSSRGEFCSRLLCAKTRVIPRKPVPFPRLELCAASLLVQLITKVRKALTIPISETYAFTSSAIVLYWLSGESSQWRTFVANRVATAQSVIPVSHWHQVLAQDNPAKLAAQGVPAGELTAGSVWFRGPRWVVETDMQIQPAEIDEIDPTDLEMRNTAVLMSTQSSFWEILERFSSFSKLTRSIAYWRRYLHNLKAKCQKKNIISGRLTPHELNEAEIIILRVVQSQSFPGELAQLKAGKHVFRESRILALNPFLDNNGLLRVGGRIRHAAVKFNHKYPILLPQKHHVTDMIAAETHRNLLHGGAQQTLSQLRQAYWPVRGLDVCKKIIRQCVSCFKVKPVAMKHFMGDCHPSRVTLVYPFYQTGIDFCGPVYIKTPVRSKVLLKMYIALYVCLSTRAIHIELVTDLTTEAFIASLKRFVSRRGKPTEILCDNATNFVGAARELKEIAQLVRTEEHQSQVTDSAASQGITFKFIPPRSPHFGGSWESTIKRIKHHLYRTVGNSHLTQEEMLTVLARIESCVNSRPLTPLSSDPADLEALTPGHFLIGRPLTALPEQNLKDLPEGRLKQWKAVDQRIQHFWHRWTAEYLHTLQQRRKWTTHHPSLTVEDLVIIKEDNLPPLKWIMGRVVQIHPGADGVPRVATVRTASGVFKRAVAKLCRLPIDGDPETQVSARSEMVPYDTRQQRRLAGNNGMVDDGEAEVE